MRAFYDAGCRYLQFDDTAWPMLCSQEEREGARARRTMPIACRRTIRAPPTRRSKAARRHGDHHACLPWQFPLDLDRPGRLRAGGREPARRARYDGYFLEYDTERAGGFEPLRFLPKGNKKVVLGLVTSKSGTLEKKDDIKRRIEEAAKYVALDQLCL